MKGQPRRWGIDIIYRGISQLDWQCLNRQSEGTRVWQNFLAVLFSPSPLEGGYTFAQGERVQSEPALKICQTQGTPASDIRKVSCTACLAISELLVSPLTRTLVILVAVIGFLFDTYELLMFPVIGRDALSELLKVAATDPAVATWTGRLLWIAALCGGIFGLLGGWMIDRFGRKTIMVASILAYSLSPVAAAFSTELWHLILFRCTTFVGVCVEMVAAVTWMAELFEDKRTREKAIAWSLAAASLGGILVTEVFIHIKGIAADLPALPLPKPSDPEKILNVHAAWRYTLLTGLIPGAAILALLPFVPESRVWREKKRAGTLRRPSFAELFAPGLLRTTVVTTILSACGYAAAFGALQLTPPQIVQGVPAVVAQTADFDAKLKAAPVPEKKAIGEAKGKMMQGYIGDIQRWQEVGGLTGRILLAALVLVFPSRVLLRIFLIPGIILFPLTYLEIVKMDYNLFAAAIFFCGLLTVAQFSFLSELLPKLFPLHLRGTGGSFATNVGGRMIGTMAAVLNTGVIAGMFGGGPHGHATGAAIIGGTVYFIAFLASFFLPVATNEEPLAGEAVAK